MAINFTDFSHAPIQESPWADVFENALKGYQIGQEPAKMERKAHEEKLANSIKELTLKHMPEDWALKKQLTQAQINKANRVGTTGAKNSAIKPNSVVANAEYIWGLSHPAGVALTPEQEKEHVDLLNKAFNTVQEHTAKGTERTGILNDTQGDRAPRSPVEKIHYELASYDKGERPYSHEKISPEEQTKGRNDLLLDIVKKTTDATTRTKLQNAVNMNITLDDVNPKNLVQYSGIMKQGDKLADFVDEHFGEGSTQFRAYQREVNKAQFAAKQMRQYLGDSIQPTAQQRLDHLTNPEAWNVTPKVAEENFNFMRDLMKRETNTLVRAATDPTIYQAQGHSSSGNGSSKVFNLATGAFE